MGTNIVVSPKRRGSGRRSKSRAGRVPVALGVSAALLASCSPDNSLVKLDADDVFYQLEAGEVDVLLVVDNSCSMEPYQVELADNFAAFLEYIEAGDVDYHIGVVTTSVAESVPGGTCERADTDAVPDAGELVGGAWITPDTDDGADAFADLVNVGICGAGYETGLDAALLALSEPQVSGANKGFLRDDAYLSLVFVSDEEDGSPLTVSEYVNAFRAVKGQRERDIFNASALVVTDPELCPEDSLAYDGGPSSRYISVAEETDGIVGDICEADFEPIVRELGLASSRLTDTFYLSEEPDPLSLVVGVDSLAVDCGDGWRFDRVGGEPAIVFDRDSMPGPKSKITVAYNLGSGNPEEFECGA